MNRNDVDQLHEMSLAELQTKLQELQVDLARTRLEAKAGRLTDTAKVKRLSTAVAQAKTVLREKQLLAQAETQVTTESTEE